MTLSASNTEKTPNFKTQHKNDDNRIQYRLMEESAGAGASRKSILLFTIRNITDGNN